MVPLTDIVTQVQSYHPKADSDLIGKAFAFAEVKHTGQMRKSGEPYFTHPASVARIIASMELDTSSVCAALLHDVVEDCEVTTDEVSTLFGSEVAFLVDGVTKLGQINFTSKEDRQAESFRKMLVAMARDIRVLLVKLADRLDNMRTLQHMKPSSQERIARETMEIYAPLAGRLGIQWLKAELEDLSFKYLYPEAHVELETKVHRVAKDTKRYIDDVTKKLSKMLISRGFALEVQGRQKNLCSVWRKMQRTGVEFEQIHDLIAFRVVMENVSDCYAALGVVHSEWTPVPGKFKDYIALPKANMYQSLHTTVIGPAKKRIEVQIRTREMHRTAEFGIAAHWKYKEKSGGLPHKDATRFTWLRELMENQKELRDPDEFIESIKVDLFPEEVYVFTPAGDVKTFPRGATPIDFAYSVHSEVGHHCAGARVNGVMAPLRQKLRNGDVVEIITKSNQWPKEGWLDFVVSTRARSRIRSYLREEERKQSIKLGRDLFESEMHKANLSTSRFAKQGGLKKLLEHFRLNHDDELYAQIGYGRISIPAVMRIVDPETVEARKSLEPGFIERTVRKVTKRQEGILIEGMDDILVRFGKCCAPVAGDPVVGWITRGRGVTIHRRTCKRALELDPERRIDVQWGKPKMDLPVSLRVTTSDRPGILAKVSTVFTDTGVNISEATCRVGDDGRAVNLFQFTVEDRTMLRTVMRGIAKIDGVQHVERM